MILFILLKEFLEDIRKQKTRAFLTTIAITWGTLAVILLMAFGEGLSFRMQQSLLNAGDRVIRIYEGQTTKKFQGMPNIYFVTGYCIMGHCCSTQTWMHYRNP